MRTLSDRSEKRTVEKDFLAGENMPNCVLVVVSFAILSLVGCGSQAKQPDCDMRLQEIADAIGRYREIEGRLPPIAICDADGHPLHSWRVLLLPYIQSNRFYGRYDLDQPWDGEDNSKLMDKHVFKMDGTERNVTEVSRIYRCGSDDSDQYHTNLVAVVSANAALLPFRSLTARDGWTTTSSPIDEIVIASVADTGIHWMQPKDLTLAELDATENTGNNAHTAKHIRSAVIVRRDGSTEHMSGLAAIQYLQKKGNQ